MLCTLGALVPYNMYVLKLKRLQLHVLKTETFWL